MHNPLVPETLEGWSLLHLMYRVRWDRLRAKSEAERSRLAEEAMRALSVPDAGATACVQMLGHKADLMFIAFRRDFEQLAQAQLALSRTELSDYLEPTTSYVSIVELGMYEMTAKIHEQLGAKFKPGSDEFEQAVESGKVKVKFPDDWSDAEDRKKAWSVVEDNLRLLEKKKDDRRQVMENGLRIDGPFFSGPVQSGAGLRFSYRVTNTDDGHNLPSGSLGAQPELWLNVALIGPDGKRVWESGHLDSIGDMADLHSLDVRAGKMERDAQLFNLQTKFLTTNVKGTEREMYLPVNLDVDQLPFLRPPGQPVTVLNHPPGVRMEQRSLPPLAARVAEYSVPAEAMAKPGKYKLAVRMRSRAEPIYFMRFVGATTDMERAMNEWMLDIHPYTVEFEVK